MKENTQQTYFTLGLRLIVRCEQAGISVEEVFDLIQQRGEYLRQEPDTTGQEGEQQ